jgi:hypothetical protein
LRACVRTDHWPRNWPKNRNNYGPHPAGSLPMAPVSFSEGLADFAPALALVATTIDRGRKM